MLQFLTYYKLLIEFQPQIYLDVAALKSSEKVPGLSGKKMLSGKVFFYVEVHDKLHCSADKTTPGLSDPSKHTL